MFDGTWVNERGSVMILEQHDEAIRGRYLTQIGNDKVARKEHAVVGLANGTTIGFVVSWPAALSLTSWAGRLEIDPQGFERIHTVWHLVRAAANAEPSQIVEVWESFLTNSSVFTRTRGKA
ncbi:unnamed protein product [Phaeothamnion confervicola]